MLNLQKSTACLPDKLPCQEVPYHPKPVVKPALPPDFRVVEETEHSNVDCKSAMRVADTPEFLYYPSSDVDYHMLMMHTLL